MNQLADARPHIGNAGAANNVTMFYQRERPARLLQPLGIVLHVTDMLRRAIVQWAIHQLVKVALFVIDNSSLVEGDQSREDANDGQR